MNNKITPFIAIALSLTLASCSLGSPESTGKYDLDGAAEPLDSSDYRKLTPLQQFQVSNKLASALFKGIPANKFFKTGTIGADTSQLQVSSEGSNYVAAVRTALKTPLANKDEIVLRIEGDENSPCDPAVTPGCVPGTVVPIPAKYTFDDRRPIQYPLAYLYEMPFSDEFFARWMAYKLMNTIMFSAAEEIDSASERDVQKMYEGLVAALTADLPIRSIILTHEKSQANWRRFRSPEDNTREMIEIYLGLFDRDADVPKASRACRNWSLTGEDEQYELKIGPDGNTVPQLVLDNYYVTTCEEFFEAVANHPLVIPRVTTVLVDHMFGVEYDTAKRTALARDIAGSQPETFKDIFLAILFSKEFLLNMDRPKWFEESYFNAAARVNWRPYSGFFREVNNPAGSGTINASLPQMYQPAFSLKLGRWPTVPGDVLATSYQHNGLRSALLVKSDAILASDPAFNATKPQSNGWGPELIDQTTAMPLPDFINYMFISVVGRAATEQEVSVLTQVINTIRTSTTPDTVDCVATAATGCLRYFTATTTASRAMVVMDYLSRLPETFFFNAVN